MCKHEYIGISVLNFSHRCDSCGVKHSYPVDIKCGSEKSITLCEGCANEVASKLRDMCNELTCDSAN